jgi:hypothetical protein
MADGNRAVADLFPPLTLLSEGDRAFLDVKAEQIRAVASNAVIEIGRHLIEAKQRVGHGNFLGWFHGEFPQWSEDTAENYMLAARAFPNSEHVRNMTARAMYLLAGPSVPQTARDEAAKRAEERDEAGDKIDKAEAERIIAEKSREAVAAALDEYREELRPTIERAIEEATARLAGDKEALVREIERIRRQEIEPDIGAVCRVIEKNLGIKKLSGEQYGALAQVLGKTIVVGRKSYDPTPREEILANEENLRIASKITEAFEALAAAPPPEALAAAAWPVQRKQHQRVIGGIIDWVVQYRRLLEAEGEINV